MTQLQRRSIWAFLLVVWCGACGTEAEAPAEHSDQSVTVDSAPSKASGESLIAFEIEGMKFSGILPEELNYVSDVRIDNGAHSAVKVVHVGSSFTIHVTRELVSLDDLKSDLLGNGLFEVVFFDEGDDSFFYELVLPDGRSAGHHYVRLMTDELGSNYVVRTGDEQEYGYFVAQLASRTLNSLKVER